MAMPWSSYLTYHHKAVSSMPDWMQREHRARIILNGYIRPQALNMATNVGEFNLIMDTETPTARYMAIRDKHDKIRCEEPVMMWDRLSGLARETISINPTKDQIEQLVHRCQEKLNSPDGTDYFMHQELKRTIDKLGILLKYWDQTDASLIRFYPPSKAARFDRYDIRPE